MPRSSYVLPAALAVVVALFFYALIHILLLRYQRGDLYPAYSTFRSDPLGARAYYEALDATGSYQVSRGFVSLHRELSTVPDTLFFLGLAPSDLQTFSRDEIAELSVYVQKGGRIVIALKPSNSQSSDETEKKNDPKVKKKTNPPPPQSDPDKSAFPGTEQEKHERDEFKKEQDKEDNAQKKGEFPQKFEPSIQALWGFGWSAQGSASNEKKRDDLKPASDPGDRTSVKGDVLALRAASDGSEAEVPWKSAGYFLRLDPAWQVRYTARKRPVLLERTWGKGDILVSSDSYFLSNEALRDDRKPILLSLVTGHGRRLLFDEVHLGTEEREGVMVLARRFRLEGYLFGLLIVAALFLWRNSVPLVPPRATDDANLLGGTVSGKDSRNGLVNLLRRNIGPREILSVCLAEWKRTADPGRSLGTTKTGAMETALQSADTSRAEAIVQAYHQLREINTGNRPKESYANRN